MAVEVLSEYENRIGSLSLVPGRGGIFEIWSGDQRLFSKAEVGRFPKDGEAKDLVRPFTE